MQLLVVLQGHSGAGKTTLANQIAHVIDAVICSTDDFHVEDGVYRFKPDKLGEFHKLNVDKAIKAMEEGRNVVIDNTNIRAYEPKPYVQEAVNKGITVKFVRAIGNFANVHGVPQEKVDIMKARLETLSVEACLAAKAPWE